MAAAPARAGGEMGAEAAQGECSDFILELQEQKQEGKGRGAAGRAEEQPH